ncbi:hypothetical protein ACFL3G_12825 [Planctomycetota bacterium]
MVGNGDLVIVVLAIFLLCCGGGSALAEPAPARATCKISCSVAGVVEWSEANFSDIDLGRITPKRKYGLGKAEFQLHTNGDVEITVDNNNNAELLLGTGDKLLTEYKLQYNGSGVDQTGGKTMPWSQHDKFLKKASPVVHISGDGDVMVMLSVRASLKNKKPKQTGIYTATQTLTACWKS